MISGARQRDLGLLSMAAYLAFWAVALVVAKRELDARWPKTPAVTTDPAVAVLRERFARGELDEAQLRAMVRVLGEYAPERPARVGRRAARHAPRQHLLRDEPGESQ
jgi:putative membrane protein